MLNTLKYVGVYNNKIRQIFLNVKLFVLLKNLNIVIILFVQ